MQFLNPVMLFSLLFLGPLIAIYMLRNKYKNIDVPSNYIWDKLMEKSSDIKKIQKFRKSLLFFIQSMVIILAALAMSKLFLNGGLSLNKPVLVIVDNSISVSSNQEKFEDSLNYVQDYLEENHVKSYELASFSSSVKLLEGVDLLNIEASNDKNDYEALELFVENQKMNRDLQIMLFTDSSLYGIDGVSIKKYPSSSRNVAISGYSIENGELIVQVSNYGMEDLSDIEMNLFKDMDIVNYSSMDIDSGETRGYVFSIDEFTRGDKIRLVLNIEDDVYFDNEIVLFTKAKELKVLIVDYENPFLTSALESIGCKVYSTDKYSSSHTNVDYIIFHGRAEENVMSNYIVIDYDEKASGNIVTSDIFKYRIESDMMKYEGECVIFNGHLFDKKNPIISKDNKSAAFYEIEGNYKRIYFGFDLDETDLIIKPGFVILLDDLLNGDNLGSRYRNYLAEDIKDMKFTGERIFNYETEVEQTSRAFAEGLYKVIKQSSDERYISVNEIDEAESDIFTKKEVFMGKDNKSTDIDRMDLSNVFILLMLLIIMIEWWLYYNECKI
ncbi:MAG: BatA domain-containing protein [Firmicutes bacterium]|nr:BatA domain-containing protein [Bacillota bacterium]